MRSLFLTVKKIKKEKKKKKKKKMCGSPDLNET